MRNSTCDAKETVNDMDCGCVGENKCNAVVVISKYEILEDGSAAGVVGTNRSFMSSLSPLKAAGTKT
jgi:hypothetical protein